MNRLGELLKVTAGLIHIDGAMGEGGGQIIRSALSLSMVTGKPFRISKIRAGRKKPGLLRQHLTAVNAAQTICGAKISGNSPGSDELVFEPSQIISGDYHFQIGSAGSATLVIQTLLPALLYGKERSTLTVEGGTHNPFAPPFDFLEKSFIPVLGRMGAHAELKLERYGFCPAGGGKIEARIEPCRDLKAISLLNRGEMKHREARAYVAALPGAIALRELSVVKEKLGWSEDSLRCVQLEDNCGPGNVLCLEVASEEVTEIFCAFGEKGVKAELVAETATIEARKYIASDAAVGRYLADQLLLPMALSGSGEFTTCLVTPHLTTNAELIEKFISVRISKRELSETSFLVSVEKA